MKEIPESVQDQIIQAIYEGRKIDAIRLYRAATDNVDSLMEAKKLIEELTAQLRAEQPDQFRVPESTGCALMMFVLIGIGASWIALG